MTDQKTPDTFQTVAGTVRLAAEAGSSLGLMGEKGVPWDEELGSHPASALWLGALSSLGGLAPLLEDGEGGSQGPFPSCHMEPPTLPRPPLQLGSSPSTGHTGLRRLSLGRVCFKYGAYRAGTRCRPAPGQALAHSRCPANLG